MDKTVFSSCAYVKSISENCFIFSKYFGCLAKEGNSTLFGYDTQAHPSRAGEKIELYGGSYYGYVIQGHLHLKTGRKGKRIGRGEAFSVPGEFVFTIGKNTKFFVIKQEENKSMHCIIKVEPSGGRLRYIDGCTDTLLISPTLIGEPCLNALYMPQGINQTMHTHPSCRMGCIFSGTGQAVTPLEELELAKGDIFYLATEQAHKFRTDRSGQFMKIVAFHPDSDFGPEHDDHPMVNRTIVNGISAREISNIRTKTTD
jgi:hypothetical protein